MFQTPLPGSVMGRYRVGLKAPVGVRVPSDTATALATRESVPPSNTASRGSTSLGVDGSALTSATLNSFRGGNTEIQRQGFGVEIFLPEAQVLRVAEREEC